ncbi:MAG: DegV family protein [Firmicutes bacterium]|nr:DegV family protein [Bacillota bacterium]
MLQIVTDSSCDLPQELIKSNNIRVVPLNIIIGDEVFQEGVDISPETFYEKMSQSRILPKTSQPVPAAFANAFRELSNYGQVLCLTLSSKLSGTYQSAHVAKKLSGVDAVIFDTLAGSLGHGLQVLKASKLAQAGCTAAEVVAELTRYREKMKIVIILKTLENVVKGGRLSRFKGSLANILNLRLLLHNQDGEVVLLDKIRGSKKLLHRALQMMQNYCPDLPEREIGITHFRNLADVETIIKALNEQFNPRNIIVNNMGATMATYAGEGGVIISC